MSDFDDLMYKLAVANRILGNEGVVDAFGHIAVRNPDKPERFFLSRSRAPGLVTREDILEFGPDGEPVKDNGPAPYRERYIHAAILNARPDVHAVVHTHAESLLPFGITNTPMHAAFHMGARIGETIPLWDIRDKFGDSTNLLVTNMDHGNDLAATLGGNRMALMRGHGNVVATPSIEATVLAAYYAMVNARVQTASIMMALVQGKGMDSVNLLTDGEIRAAGQSGDKGTVGVNRSWEYLESRCCTDGI